MNRQTETATHRASLWDPKHHNVCLTQIPTQTWLRIRIQMLAQREKTSILIVRWLVGQSHFFFCLFLLDCYKSETQRYQIFWHFLTCSDIFWHVLILRLRERELQLQSDLTTASREINRLRMNIKQAASTTHAQRPDTGGHPGLTSASLASLSLRSPPSDSDRQH